MLCYIDEIMINQINKKIERTSIVPYNNENSFD